MLTRWPMLAVMLYKPEGGKIKYLYRCGDLKCFIRSSSSPFKTLNMNNCVCKENLFILNLILVVDVVVRFPRN